MNVPSVESEVLKGHEDEVYHVMFSPSGKYFSTTGKDGTVIVSTLVFVWLQNFSFILWHAADLFM